MNVKLPRLGCAVLLHAGIIFLPGCSAAPGVEIREPSSVGTPAAIDREALVALQAFQPGSTVTLEGLRKLERVKKFWNSKAEEEWIEALKFEMAAATERLLTDPNTGFYLGEVSPPEDRQRGNYSGSGDDLAGLRFIMQLRYNVARPGEIEDMRLISGIVPLVLAQGRKICLLSPPDNFRIRAQLFKTTPPGRGVRGLSFAVACPLEGGWEMSPGVYMTAEGCPRYPNIALTATALECFDCHQSASRLPPSKKRLMDKELYTQMEGFEDFLALVAQETSDTAVREQVRRDLLQPRALWVLEELKQANRRFWERIYPGYRERLGNRPGPRVANTLMPEATSRLWPMVSGR